MKNGKKYIIILLVLIFVAVSLNTYTRYKKEINPNYNILNLKDDPMSLSGFTQVDIDTTDTAMILTNNCKSIAMSTNQIQTYSIQQGMNNKIDARPLSHDIMKGILDNYDIKVLMVKITDLGQGLYTANLFLKKDDQVLNLESRPSDAIAIAVRENAPIYLERSILDSEGQNSC